MTTQNQTVRKILIAPDKFKGSLTSLQAANAIKRGMEEKSRYMQFQIVEIADGGDGSLDVVAGKVDSPQLVSVDVHDPLFREISSQILLYGGGDSPLCAFIEMAKISGLAILEKSERNPLNTSTYGLGEAICIARRMGAKKITLSIGGSATDDCGAGMLQALGFEFFNRAGELMPVP
ncbi:MAG: glycerate kinase, partial [Bacteroidales bacterium]|nr:glycerate kinase [Bacteroidales bacterium]